MFFRYPVLLFGFFAVLIPIAIHFLSKLNKSKYSFPMIFLFEKAIMKRNNLSKLNHLMLMLIRVLIIILLVTTLAQPYIEYNTNKLVDKVKAEEKLYLILIDDTFGTSIKYHTTSLVEKYKSDALDFVENTEDGSIIGIAHFNTLELEPKYYVNKKDAMNYISLITTSSSRKINVSERMEIIIDDFEKQKAKEKYLVLFSDLQRRDWENIGFDNNIENMTIIHKTIDTKDFRNISIYNPYTPQTLKFTGQGFNLYCNIDSYSNKSETVKLQVSYKGNTVSEKDINLKPYEKSIQEIDHVIFDEGCYNLELAVNHDDYIYDNYTKISIPVSKNLNVYIAVPESDNIISRALKSSVGTKYQTDKSLLDIDIDRVKAKQYDVILIYNATALSSEDIAYISSSRQKGALIVVFYSKEDNVFKLSQLLNSNLNLSLKLTERRDSKTKIIYPPSNTQFNNELELLNLDNFNVYFSDRIGFELLSEDAAVYLHNDKKRPLLIGNRPKNIFFFGADIDFESSNIIYNQTFPLLINELIYISVKGELERTKGDDDNISNPGDIILNQGETIYLSIEDFKNILPAEVEYRTYNDISDIKFILGNNNKDVGSKPINSKYNILLTLLVLIMGVEVIYSSYVKG